MNTAKNFIKILPAPAFQTDPPAVLVLGGIAALQFARRLSTGFATPQSIDESSPICGRDSVGPRYNEE
jgi:hypothetical protein